MSDTTPRLALAELTAAQAQKHVTVNENLIALDALINAQVTSMALTAPPDDPDDGDCYIVADSATDDWADYDGKIAYCIDGDWTFYTPFKGQMIYNAADSTYYRNSGSAWTADIPSLSAAQTWSQRQTFSAGATISGAFITGGGNFSLLDAGTVDTDAVHVFSTSGNLYLQAGSGNYIYYRSKTAGVAATLDTKNSLFGIGTENPTYPVDVYYSGVKAGVHIYNSGSDSDTAASLWLETASMSNAWQIKAGNSNVLTFGIANVADYIRIDSSYEIYPATANSGSVGTTSYPFANGYFENGVTTTSDEQLKRNKSFVADSEALLAVGRHMAQHISAYQMLAAVNQKGDAARYHFGVSSQDAMAAFDAAGLDWKKYGIVCAQKLDRDYLAPDGKTVLLKAGATTYYVRQEEADKLIMAALVAKLSGLHADEE